MFSEIPATRPETRLLDEVDAGRSVRELSPEDLLQLANDLRAYLLYSVGQSGGHFGAGLGVIELTIALHHIYNTPNDRIVWDVGHQAYPHKILTGRMQRMHSMRQAGGFPAFPSAARASTTPSASATPPPVFPRPWAWRWPRGRRGWTARR